MNQIPARCDLTFSRKGYFTHNRRYGIKCLLLILVAILYGLIQYHNASSPMIEMSQPVEIAQPDIISEVSTFISSNSEGVDNVVGHGYAMLVAKYSYEMNLDPFVVAGLIHVESRFVRYAVSPKGAIGLMQILPQWHKEKIAVAVNRFGYCDLFKPEHNIFLGVSILSDYKKQEHGNIERALLRYNGALGRSTGYSHRVLGIAHLTSSEGKS